MNHRILSLPLVLTCLVPTSAHADPRARQLSAPSAGGTTIDDAGVSPDGEWIVYTNDSSAFPGSHELWSVRRGAGSARISLSGSPGAGSEVEEFQIAPDSRRVVYRLQTPSGPQLWSVPIGGPDSSAVLLTPALAAGASTIGFSISPDGARVVFDAEVDAVDQASVWSVPVDGPGAAAVRLSPAPVAGGGLSSWRVTPNGSRVVVRADLDVAGVDELWSVPIGGPAASAVKLHPDLAAGQEISVGHRLTADSARVVFIGSLQVAGQRELWSAALGGPGGTATALSLPTVVNGDVAAFDLSPDGQRVVYRGDLVVDGRDQLWSVPTAGPAAMSVQLGPTPVPAGDITSFEISPTGTHVAFRGDGFTDGLDEVWISPIDGPAASSRIVTPNHGGGATASFLTFSVDGQWLVFRGDFDDDGVSELWSAEVAGSGRNAADLSGSIVAGGAIDRFEIDANGTTVVFGGDLTLDSRDWLYSSPLDASAGRTTLTNLLVAPAGADVADDWTLTRDGAWVIYRADSQVDERFDLRRVAATGGSGSLLHPAIDPTRDVVWLMPTADSRGVLYGVDGTAVDLWLADEWIFAADFEEGNTGEWSP